MGKGKKAYWRGGILLAVLLVSTVCIGGQALTAPSGNEERADIVRIDVLRKFGGLEKPEVVFLHDRHTEALKKQGKDCKVCHLSKGNEIPGNAELAVSRIDVLSPKFRRLEDTARKDVMDTYHKFCIDCHTEMRTAGDESGPITCGECHKPASTTSAWKSIGFDKSLHWRHTKTMDKKCERCHHDYDEKEKKKVYVKGKEGSCRYCHKEVAQEKRLALRDAAHLDCISCHRDRLAQKQSAGPILCSGCHLDANQKKIEKVADIPRMERNQPNETLVATGIVSDNPPANVVAFNHKAHEEYSDTCRVCHHESLDKCSKCHTFAGAKEGGQVKLEQAFHLVTSDKSCVGCHVTRQKDPRCAGCHVFMEKQRRPDDQACLKCHVTPSPEVAGAVKAGDEKRIKALAHKMIQDRPAEAVPVAEKDIPEKVVLNSMMKQYQAVELPHRKIVNRLRQEVKDSKMAGFFHGQDTTLCQGCHHNGPATTKPPKCASCHGQSSDDRQPMRPGLMGAYHQQCMTCHEEMKLEKPAGCLGCHKENKEKA